MIMRHERISGPSTALPGAVVAGFRVVLAGIAGLVLMLSALLFAVFLGGVVMLWKLLGARRGQMAYFGWRGGRTRSRPGATQGDVIDVDAAALPASQPATPALQSQAAALAAPAAPSGA